MKKSFINPRRTRFILTLLASFSPTVLLALEFLKITPEDFARVENASRQPNFVLVKALQEEQAFRTQSWDYLRSLRE